MHRRCVVAGPLAPLGLAVVLSALLGFGPGGAAVFGAEIRGTLILLGKNGERSPSAGQPREAVVFFEPRGGARAEPIRSQLVTRGKEFLPQVQSVTIGSTVTFPNEDPILHNVFSVSGENRFDLGLSKQGPGKSHTFEHAGLVRVFCNVHSPMAAYVNVLATPYFTTPDVAGRFVLADLPGGSGQLVVWHPRAEPASVEVELKGPLLERDLELRITRPRVPPHMNKFGKPYRKTGDY